MQNNLVFEQLKGKKKSLQESLDYRQTVIKTRDFICRQLANSKNIEKSCNYYSLLYSLERISTECVNLLKYVKTKDVLDLSLESKKYFIRANELVERFAMQFFGKNFKNNFELMKEKDYLIKELFYKLTKDKKNDPVVLHHCANIVRRVADMNAQFLGMLF